jgi:hypothetical protein
LENPKDYEYKVFIWLWFIVATVCSIIAGGLCRFSTPGYLVPSLAGELALLFGLGALIEAQARFSEGSRTNSFKRYQK